MSGFTFSAEQDKEIERLLAKYPFKKSAMLPLLTLVQRAERQVSPEAMVAIVKNWIALRLMCSRSCLFIRCTTRKRWGII